MFKLFRLGKLGLLSSFLSVFVLCFSFLSLLIMLCSVLFVHYAFGLSLSVRECFKAFILFLFEVVLLFLDKYVLGYL